MAKFNVKRKSFIVSSIIYIASIGFCFSAAESKDSELPIALPAHPPLFSIQVERFEDAVQMLTKKTGFEQEIGRQVIYKITTDENNPDYHAALGVLLKSPAESDRDKSLKILFRILLTHGGQQKIKAAEVLLESPDNLIGARILAEEEREFTPARFRAGEILENNYGRGKVAQDTEHALNIYRAFASTPNDLRYRSACKLLSIRDLSPPDQNLAWDAFRFLSNNPPFNRSNIFSIANELEKGPNEPADQNMAAEVYRRILRDESLVDEAYKYQEAANKLYNGIALGKKGEKLKHEGEALEAFHSILSNHIGKESKTTLADILYKQKNLKYRDLACLHYEAIVKAGKNLDEMCEKLLKHGTNAQKELCLAKLRATSTYFPHKLLLTYGNPEEKKKILNRLDTGVNLDGRYTRQGPDAAADLVKYGAAGDIEKIMQTGSPDAKSRIKHALEANGGRKLELD